MEEKQLFTYLNIPKAAQISRNFPFQTLEKQLTLDERKYFQSVVESRGMRLLATFNPNTTNIAKYEDDSTRYEEIHLFQLKVQQLKQTEMKRIYTILANVMPYPLIIRFTDGDKAVWGLAEHRVVEKTKRLKVEKIFLTDDEIAEIKYLNSWTFDLLNKYSLKAFYEDFIEKMAAVNLENKHLVRESADAVTLYEELAALEQEINKYVTKAKKEPQLNKRIEWQMKATKLKQQKERLIKGD